LLTQLGETLSTSNIELAARFILNLAAAASAHSHGIRTELVCQTTKKYLHTYRHRPVSDWGSIMKESSAPLDVETINQGLINQKLMDLVSYWKHSGYVISSSRR
jgi:hypothetical protein